MSNYYLYTYSITNIVANSIEGLCFTGGHHGFPKIRPKFVIDFRTILTQGTSPCISKFWQCCHV